MSARKQLVLEVVYKLIKLQELVNSDREEKIELNFKVSDSLQQSIKMLRVIDDGSSFSSQIQKIKLKTMLSIPEDSATIKHLAYIMQTAPHRHLGSFRKEIMATDNDLLISLNKHTATDYVRISNSENKTIYAGKTAVKNGKKVVMRVKKGTSATIEFPVYPKQL